VLHRAYAPHPARAPLHALAGAGAAPPRRLRVGFLSAGEPIPARALPPPHDARAPPACPRRKRDAAAARVPRAPGSLLCACA
jgi:hypothetical protein